MMKKIIFFSLVIFALRAFPSHAQSAMESAPSRDFNEALSSGATAVYLLNFGLAESQFRRAIEIAPEHPAGYFFLAVLRWYQLVYDTPFNKDSEVEKNFRDQLEVSIEKAKGYAENPATRAVGLQYWGAALGTKGKYFIVREKWVRAYFTGRKAYTFLQDSFHLNPSVTDVRLGLGMYEYYAATLAPTLRALASFAISGDRDKAMEHITAAEKNGSFVRMEATLFLWEAAVQEGRFADAQCFLDTLDRNIPNSPLFQWCRIQTEYVQGHWENVITDGDQFIGRAARAPQFRGTADPHQKLLSKVLYHCGMSAFRLKRMNEAKLYFDAAIDQHPDFTGWKTLAYLRRGEIFDMEGKWTRPPAIRRCYNSRILGTPTRSPANV
jgi:tetratricopeptide (TPR) repeat protein